MAADTILGMLARYKIHRGKRPADSPLPAGIRQDTRKHTRHCLRPPAEIVAEYLSDPSDAAWEKFAAEYQRTLEARYAADPAPMDAIAERAREEDVYLGCSCPTANNPDVNRCHTVLALKFFGRRYPDLEITFPRRL